MKLAIRLLLIGSLTYILSIHAPWWTLFVITFVVTFFIHGSGLNAFISGFLGVGIVWIAIAWYLDFKSEHVFSDKIVQLFPVDQSIYLVVISGLIGGICGGFGSLTGNSFKQLFIKKQKKSFYS
ncbi:MAG: ABC-type iron transport system FetAB permease component [Cyclobacteriaceae bacterium]|jgi:ABC-type iron transport system FetAB permease component